MRYIFHIILNNFRCKKKQIENYGFRKCGTSMSETNLKEYFTDGQNIKREFDIIL